MTRSGFTTKRLGAALGLLATFAVAAWAQAPPSPPTVELAAPPPAPQVSQVKGRQQFTGVYQVCREDVKANA